MNRAWVDNYLNVKQWDVIAQPYKTTNVVDNPCYNLKQTMWRKGDGPRAALA